MRDFFPTSLRSYGLWPRDVASLHAHEEASGGIWWTVMGFPSCFARRDLAVRDFSPKEVSFRKGDDGKKHPSIHRCRHRGIEYTAVRAVRREQIASENQVPGPGWIR